MGSALRGQKLPKPQDMSDSDPTAQLERMSDLVFALQQSLAESRQCLLQIDQGLGSPQGPTPLIKHALENALEQNDEQYATMVQLRWLLLRKHERAGPAPTSISSILKPGGNRMNEQPSKVYVVDDSPSVRRAMSRLLKSVGMQVEVFSSAGEFLEHDLPDAPTCVVLDIRMPRISGLDLQRELANRGLDVPIIFITGHGDINMAVKAMKDGAVDFLPKPVNDQDLISAINRALVGHKSRREDQAEIAVVQKRADRLTPRERQVMEMVVTGMLNKQVAYDLGTAEKTIKVHRARVMEKMEAESLAELVRLAARIGIEGPTDDPVDPQ